MHAVRNGKRHRTEGFRAKGFHDRGNPREKDARTQLPERRGCALIMKRSDDSWRKKKQRF